MTERKETKKSPIKDLPVRTPGQSLREHVDNLIDEGLMPWVMIALCMILFAVFNWLAIYFNILRSPWFFTIMAGIIVAITGVKIWRHKDRIKALRLGQIGEEAVGQFLDEKLRPDGYQVLHDIQADTFNIDHVVIGPSGVYAVETKTHSKPIRGACEITYDGETVRVNGFNPDRDPVVQALSQGRWLHDLIKASTGKEFKIQPVVLYPGWYVHSPLDWPAVWVMNHEFLIKTLAKQYVLIDDPDVHLITYHLKRYVIAREKETKASR